MNYLTYSQRLENLIKDIKLGKTQSPKKLAEKYCCSEKTIRRMINHLRLKGYKITYCRKNLKYLIK
jgi:predicted DNA-binding transcriptional regulator YafY